MWRTVNCAGRVSLESIVQLEVCAEARPANDTRSARIAGRRIFIFAFVDDLVAKPSNPAENSGFRQAKRAYFDENQGLSDATAAVPGRFPRQLPSNW